MNKYRINNAADVVTPAIVYYKDMIRANTNRAIEIAGGANRLWPHVKTHKSIDMIRLQMEIGITRFKCSQIAELEMVCTAGAEAATLAMAPVGPTPKRLLAVQAAFPATKIYAIVDCRAHMEMYEAAAAAQGATVSLLLDINLGMNRTGLPLDEAADLYRFAEGLAHVHVAGLHCYDGDRHEADFAERQSKVDPADEKVFAAKAALQEAGYDAGIVILGGTPSFPCHAKHRGEGVYYSPGTIFVGDVSFCGLCPELETEPAAAILCRVVSHPTNGYFTVDVGSKGIASEMPLTERGVIAGLSHYRFVSQSEEHLVFCMEPGYEDERPMQGEEIYFIPHHVCPCTALYPEILVAEKKDGGWEITGNWPVTARNRKITF